MRIFFILFMLNVIVVSGSVEVRYAPASGREEARIREWLMEERVLDKAAGLINREIALESDLKVMVGEGDSTYYDPEILQIKIPYDFILEVKDRFAREYGDDWKVYTGDALEHTFYHELGHALIDILEIPVLGKEEDAVDDFGVIMLILTREEGDDMAISASELFFMEGEEIEELTSEDLMDEHSLDDQRGYRGLCMVYGSNPQKYEDMAEEMEMDEERRDVCIETFDTQTYNWLSLLSPHLRGGILQDTLDELVD